LKLKTVICSKIALKNKNLKRKNGKLKRSSILEEFGRNKKNKLNNMKKKRLKKH
jgi:hypothetical protein